MNCFRRGFWLGFFAEEVEVTSGEMVRGGE
jgi:hypothetical protein